MTGAEEIIGLNGKLATPGLIGSYIHLDKAFILDRCAPEPETGPTNHAARVTEAKEKFTVEDVYERACRTLEKCISNGTTRMRTHVETDPPAGLICLEGVMQAAKEYAWAIDVEICALPQEGLTQADETDAFLFDALDKRATCIDAAGKQVGSLNRSRINVSYSIRATTVRFSTVFFCIASRRLVSAGRPRRDPYLPYRRQAQGSARITNQIQGSRRS